MPRRGRPRRLEERASARRPGGPVRDPARGGAGRLRRGLRGVRHGVEPGRGGEDAAAVPSPARPLVRLDQEGSGGGGAARPPLHRDALRRGDVRLRSVPRHGTAARQDARPAHRGRTHPPGRGPAHRRGDGEGARPRAPARRPAPGPQARERVPLRGRAGEAPRLRAGAPAGHRGRERRRNPGLHGSGAGAGRGGGPAGRRVRGGQGTRRHARGATPPTPGASHRPRNVHRTGSTSQGRAGMAGCSPGCAPRRGAS